MVAFTTLLFPNTDAYIRSSHAKWAENLDLLSGYDWCSALVDDMKQCAMKYAADKNNCLNPAIGGCGVFLLLFYIDNLDHASVVVDKETLDVFTMILRRSKLLLLLMSGVMAGGMIDMEI
ncbi:hypothetical protein ACP4OV_031717 [Aristida adscensionis]